MKRNLVIVLTVLLVVTGIFAWGAYLLMIRMPGNSYQGDPPPLSDEQRQLTARLQDHVRTLAGTIGERNLGRFPDRLSRSADYIESEFSEMGYQPESQRFTVFGDTVRNVFVSKEGTHPESPRLVVGAHYDSIEGSPGANDNATGVAATLELARYFRDRSPERPIDFVAFVNEEPPYFTTENMGSAQYARELSRKNVDVKTMISLETIGYYSDEPGSQQYPFPFNLFYPGRGNFVGFVGNVWYRRAVRRGIGAFRSDAKIPSQGVAAPGFIPGIGWSDHRSFWQYGYPAFMVTDTALYRYPHYHRPTDTPETVDYTGFTRVTHGMRTVIKQLSRD